MKETIASVNDIVWGAPTLLLILGVGLYLTWHLRFAQIRFLPESLRRFVQQFLPGNTQKRDASFQALCAALAATVGTGNLVGVAGAISLGGLGAVFWMWICGILGMVTKYAEAVLAVRYRVKAGNIFLGGPMYVIREGLCDVYEAVSGTENLAARRLQASFWQEARAKGYDIPIVGSSDTHSAAARDFKTFDYSWTIVFAKNKETASSFAPFMTAQAFPPFCAQSMASFRHGNASRSGLWKVSGPQERRSSGATVQAVRSG